MNDQTATIAGTKSREDFRHRFAEMRSTLDASPTGAAPAFLELRAEFDGVALGLRRALLGSPLAWTDEEKRDARWLHRTCDDFAAVGYRLSYSLAKELGMGDKSTRDVIAGTLFFMGETVKWDISVAPDAPHDLRKVHTLMKVAMEGGRQREPLRARVDARDRACTIEGLYFRVLLLARFASGALNNKQIEILDAWMWLWMPVLAGVSTPPPGSALRADLDSSGGLQRGPRSDAGPSLYLPQGPIEGAYRCVVAEFHAGRIVPAEGIASEFRLEEHIAVLDLIRHGLQQAQRPSVARATRRAVDRSVEIHVGLGDIMARAFMPLAVMAPSISIVGGLSEKQRKSDTAMDDIYVPGRRTARLVDESETGMGLEGTVADCGSIAAGDLLAVRLSPAERVVLCKVVRSVPSKAPGRVFLGVHRLTADARLLDVQREPGDRPAEKVELVFVPGEDSCGRHDACLVSERAFAERAKVVVPADGKDFTLRLNRVRERGRGWVLAGFEVVTSRPHAALGIEIA